MNRGGVRWHQCIQLTKAVGDSASIETGSQFALIWINVVDIANIAVEYFLVVVVLDLHDLVTGREGPAKAFNLALSGGIERRLQCDIEGPSADAPAIHWAKHLDIPDGIETKAPRVFVS